MTTVAEPDGGARQARHLAAVDSTSDARVPPAAAGCDVEIVVPVHNEEADLSDSVRRLHAYLDERFPFSWRITVVDNASTDATWGIACRLVDELAGVGAVHLERKGRGRALRAAWSASDAAVVAYMDVDLSTDLDALLPLVSPLLSGHSEVAIGSRLVPGARVRRGPKREVLSRGYNLLLRSVFRAGFRDAQCGFKALRTDVARQLLPLVENDNWFFDTELLLLTRRLGLRVFEVPVDWVDDPDSRVNIRATVMEDLRGMARMARRFVTASVPSPADRPDDLARHATRFALVGAFSTVGHLAGFAALRPSLGPVGANLVALGVATVANTVAHRRFTFGLVGPEDRLRQSAASFTIFLATAALSSAALVAASVLVSDSTLVLGAVLVGVQASATAARFAAMRSWVFASGPDRGGDQR